MSPETFRQRRQTLSEKNPGVAFLLPAAPHALRNRTVFHSYRCDSDLFYLTGIEERDARLVLRADGAAVLYAPEPDPERARWEGAMPSLTDLGARAGVDDVRALGRLEQDMCDHLKECESVAFRLGRSAALDSLVIAALERAANRRRGARVISTIRDPHGPIGELRAIKQAWEIERIRRSVELAAEAHISLMKSARAGQSGLALAGRFESSVRDGGAVRMAYETIVASGSEAVYLHALPSPKRLVDGELVLVDAGCELDGYASDITRGWPVGATFSSAQAAVYDAVLEAQLAALSEVRIGRTLADVHERARGCLETACRTLGLPGEVERWFPHPTSHWLGLDVHDAGPYERSGKHVVLEENMVFTVEPGLYVGQDALDAPEPLRGIGVRIEDTVVVSRDGAVALSVKAPKERDAICSIRFGC